MSNFSAKTGDHLLGSVKSASNFCWIWLILKRSYSRRLFTFRLIRLNPRFITYHYVPDVFRRTAIIFFEQFLLSIDRILFWAVNKLYRILRQQIFFTVKYSCNIECMLVLLMPNLMSQSHDRSLDDFSISIGAKHQWFPDQQLILDDLYEIHLGANYNLGWNHHSINKHWPLMELHCQKFN